MNTYSPEMVAETLSVYRSTRRSPFKTATKVGIAIADVFAILDANQDTVDVAQERFGGMGRPEMQDFIVARRRADNRDGWDNTSDEIKDARAKFCAGTHTMSTGRDGQWLILYAIPLKRAVAANANYFEPATA